MGTLSYMSPEQVQGQEPDPRSDIFSLGVVLYEMATGKRPFEKDSSVETLKSILTEDPPDLLISAMTPLDQIVRRCLQKQSALRFQSAAEVAAALESVRIPAASEEFGVLAKRSLLLQFWPLRRGWQNWLTLLTLLVGAVALARLGSKPARLPLVQFSIYPPEGVTFESVRYGGPPLVSPDGSMLAFCARAGDGVRRIWIRRLDSLTAHSLRGTDAAIYPFWSPDGRHLGFFAEGMLKEVPLDGGPPSVIVPAMAYGAAWTQKDGAPGTILYTPADNPGLARISANGGTSTPVTTTGPLRQEVHRHPVFLPDGRHFVFLVEHAEDDAAEVFAGDIEAKPDAKSVHRIMATTQGKAWWAPPGYLLFLRDNNLTAQRFDASRLELNGEPFLVKEHVGNGFNRWTSDFSVSSTGILAWRGGFNARRDLVWLDRGGHRVDSLELQGPYWFPRLSADGRRFAMVGPGAPVLGGISNAAAPRAKHIWSSDPVHAQPTLLTFGQAVNTGPVWSPSGDQIAFGHREAADCGLYLLDTRNNGSPTLLVRTAQLLFPSSWSPDGNLLLVSKEPFGSGAWAIAVHDRSKPILMSAQDGDYQISPDGHWAAFTDGKTGHLEVSVRAFDEKDPASEASVVRLSSGIGYSARWRRDGKELFYIDGRNMIAAPVETGRTFKAGNPVRLFDLQDFELEHVSYDVSPDGSRFLVSRLREDENRPVNIALNWLAAAKK